MYKAKHKRDRRAKHSSIVEIYKAENDRVLNTRRCERK